MMGFGATTFGATMATLDEDTEALPSPSDRMMPRTPRGTFSSLNASHTTIGEKPKRRKAPMEQFKTFEPTPPGKRGANLRTKKKKYKTQVKELTEEEDMGATQAMETWGSQKNKASAGVGFANVITQRRTVKIDDLLLEREAFDYD